MRQLITNDVYKLSRILKKMQLKSEDLKTDLDSENADQAFGINLLLKVVENAYMAQDEINDLIGGLCGLSGEDFGNLPITESVKLITEFNNLDGISDFFAQAGRLMK